MNRSERSELADRIANEHGCDIAPTAVGQVAIQVQGRWQAGFPRDGERIATCRKALIAAGIAEAVGWLS